MSPEHIGSGVCRNHIKRPAGCYACLQAIAGDVACPQAKRCPVTHEIGMGAGRRLESQVGGLIIAKAGPDRRKCCGWACLQSRSFVVHAFIG